MDFLFSIRLLNRSLTGVNVGLSVDNRAEIVTCIKYQLKGQKNMAKNFPILYICIPARIVQAGFKTKQWRNRTIP